MSKTEGRSRLDRLLEEVRACRLCADHLPLGVRPVLSLSRKSRILIAGQAPGRRVHESGIPFADPSGIRLREWLGVTESEFRDTGSIGILPMAFCYPGRGRDGDLPPRPECAATWRARLLELLPRVELTILVGAHALAWHRPDLASFRLTEATRRFADFLPRHFPIPHPSPRNNLWLARNPWFEKDVVPALRARVRGILEA